MEAEGAIGRRWLWARIYAAVGAVMFASGIVGSLVEIGLSHGEFPRWSPLLVFLGAPSIWLFFSLGVFRPPYSVFGKGRRTPLPSTPPSYQKGASGGCIGEVRFTGPFLSWYVWPEGIGFAGVGEGFVPKELVRKVELRRHDGRIFHDSVQVRSPLVVPWRMARAAADFDSIPAGVTALRPGQHRTKAHRLGPAILLAGLVLFGAVAAAFIRLGVQTENAREEVRRFVRAAGENAELLVDGRRVRDPDVLLGRLRNLEAWPGHHSHPTRRFPVVVIDGDGKLRLELARDSSYRLEYWVFLPGNEVTRRNEIGRIRTRALDSVP